MNIEKRILFFFSIIIIILYNSNVVYSINLFNEELKGQEIYYEDIRTYLFDIDGDNEKERIVLSALVWIEEDDKLSWDDGNWWKLTVYDEERIHVLFHEFVRSGSLYVTMGKEIDDTYKEKEGSMPMLTLIIDDSIHFSVYAFRYNPLTGVFDKNTILKLVKKVASFMPRYEDIYDWPITGDPSN